MKSILPVFVLLCLTGTHTTIAVAKEEAGMSPEQMAQAEQSYAKWFNQLNEQLLQSDAPYAMAMGLAAILHGSLQDLNQLDSDEAKQGLQLQVQMLNQLIQRDDLSNDTLELLRTWCFKPAIMSGCDHDTLLDKQLTQSPDNLNVYLSPLALAMDRQDQALTDQIIKLMATTQVSHESNHITEAFNQRLDQYLRDNPVPEVAIDAFLDDRALLAGSGYDGDQLRELVRAYFPASIKLSYVNLFDSPNSDPLYQYCKNRPDAFNACLNISQVLINSSNSIRFKGLGYAMLMGMHEAQGNQDLLQAVHNRQLKYKEQIECLSAASRSTSLIGDFLDPKYQEINLLPIDEIKKLDLLATYVYQKHKLTNPKHRDPQSCYASNP